MSVTDRDYDDRDTYASTPDGAAASASYHAIEPYAPSDEEIEEMRWAAMDPAWWAEVEELADHIEGVDR